MRSKLADSFAFRIAPRSEQPGWLFPARHAPGTIVSDVVLTVIGKEICACASFGKKQAKTKMINAPVKREIFATFLPRIFRSDFIFLSLFSELLVLTIVLDETCQ